CLAPSERGGLRVLPRETLVGSRCGRCAALYRGEQLGHHLRVALENGLSVAELSEAITHLAFYAGWPNAMTAITRLKQIADEQAAA
ncbi:carboxymuconolactone decarboxylase family protein, partial [Streptomyces hygroscopicus]|uniref:carboxymuconolactone decarboxylase family protein n=1 Tax=Streptomyces hygroscopicus TaxID=1912 RepID=UPI0036BC485C